MASLASFISASLHPLHHSKLKPFSPTLHKSISFVNFNFTKTFPNSTTRVFASTPNSLFNQDSDSDNSRSKKSVLFDLIQDIEPLDVSLIQKDVSHTTIDAMKRTISGMLGVLPSDQFQVTIEALWDSLFKLLISSMMTGYTLRNAEYRLCLERNLDIHNENMGNSKAQDSKQTILDGNRMNGSSRRESSPMLKDSKDVMYDIPDFGEMTPDAREYILKLHSSLSSTKKELYEVKRKNAALQMQQFVGEEKNDLLDYLRSLPPEKVAELSEPTSPELKDTIHSVVHGLLATLSPKMHSKGPDVAENSPIGMVDAETEVDIVEDTSLIFQPLISLPRDYLARLLFWCMLLGHYLRGLEYRCELMEVLSLSHDDDDGSNALSDT